LPQGFQTIFLARLRADAQLAVDDSSSEVRQVGGGRLDFYSITVTLVLSCTLVKAGTSRNSRVSAAGRKADNAPTSNNATNGRDKKELVSMTQQK
jgi:hypothetical protein